MAQNPATAPVLTEHRFASIGEDDKAAGEGCSEAGLAECADGVCLHVGDSPEAGYVCSRRCEDSGECPSGWRCGFIHPTDPDSRLCIPPSDAAEAR